MESSAMSKCLTDARLSRRRHCPSRHSQQTLLTTLLVTIVLISSFATVNAVGTPPTPPIIDSFRVIDGQPATVRCTSQGDPMPIVSWKFANGSSINTVDGRRSAEGSVLLFRPFLKAQDYPAIYKCSARNSLSTASQDNTPEIGVSPKMTIRPQVVTVDQGKNASLHCVASGHPTPHYRWYKDGNTAEIIAKGHELHLNNAQYNHSGWYTCRAENWAGHVDSKAFVTVKHAPVVTVEEPIIYGEQGSRISLTCQYTSNPKPTVKWFRDRVALVVQADRYEQKDSMENSATLILKAANVADGADYTCLAANHFGSASATQQLIIRGPPLPPEIITILPSKYGVTVDWNQPTRPGNHPITGHRISVMLNDELVQVLDVKSPPSGQRASGSVFVKGLDSGTVYQITMVALSSSGTSTSSKKKVASTSLTPPYRANITDITSSRVDRMRVSWETRHDGGAPATTCAIDYKPLSASGPLVAEEAARPKWKTRQVTGDFSPGIHHAMLTNLTMDTVYEVKVRCRNRIGWNRWSPISSAFTQAKNSDGSSEESTGKSNVVTFAAAGIGGGVALLIAALGIIIWRRRTFKASCPPVVGTKIITDQDNSNSGTTRESPTSILGEQGSSPLSKHSSGSHRQRNTQTHCRSFPDEIQKIPSNSFSTSNKSESSYSRPSNGKPSAFAIESVHRSPHAAGSRTRQASDPIPYKQELCKSLSSISQQPSIRMAATFTNTNINTAATDQERAMPTTSFNDMDDPVRLGCYGADSSPDLPLAELDGTPTRRFQRGSESRKSMSGRTSILQSSNRSNLAQTRQGSVGSDDKQISFLEARAAIHCQAPTRLPPGPPATRSKTLPSNRNPSGSSKYDTPSSRTVPAKVDIDETVLDLRRPRDQGHSLIYRQNSRKGDGLAVADSMAPIHVMQLRPLSRANSAKASLARSNQPLNPGCLHRNLADTPSDCGFDNYPDGSSSFNTKVTTTAVIENRADNPYDAFQRNQHQSQRNLNVFSDQDGGPVNSDAPIDQQTFLKNRNQRNFGSSLKSKSVSLNSIPNAVEYEVDKGCVVDGVEYPPTVKRVANGAVIGFNSYV